MDPELPLEGEIGRIHGVRFVDEDGNPLPPYDPSQCPACKRTKNDGTWWSACQFIGYYEFSWSVTRWRCPCGNDWVTHG